MRSLSRHTATHLGVWMLVGGFVLLFLTWKGVAATRYIPAQFAYALSGGLSGLGLIGFALTVLNAQTTRLLGSLRAGDLEDLLDETVDTLAVLERRMAAGVRATELGAMPVDAPVATAAAASSIPASSNGHAPAARVSDVDHGPWRPGVLLMPGARTFHREGCRIVGDPERALHLTVEEADGAGLRPCRICGGQ